MSYCRMNDEDSDAYIIGAVDGGWECLGCRITPKQKWISCIGGKLMEVEQHPCVDFDSLEDLLAHMHEHNRLNVKVPKRAIARVKRDIKERDRGRRHPD